MGMDLFISGSAANGKRILFEIPVWQLECGYESTGALGTRAVSEASVRRLLGPGRASRKQARCAGLLLEKGLSVRTKFR